ncbi:hypothetical protein GE061_016607 [Apolygus lucorum]|uniref:Uncharacterized protein n=1 Tax=Apolygus lucorum TaxID=248454 RepID=A0A6A4K541_APOLU|nr:hypothetical protein GE061_016607 [Apolygus lucorum]
MLASIIGRIWSRLNSEILKNGFGKAGIYPFNSGVVDESSYDPKALKRWKQTQAPRAAENPPANVPPTSSESQAQVPVANSSLSSSAGTPPVMPSTSDADTSFEEKIISFLRGGQQTSTTQKRKRVGTGSEVLTTEDVLARLENEKSKKKGPQKSKKKGPPKRTKKRAAKKNVTPETSDDEDFIASTRTRRRAAKKNCNPLDTTDEDEEDEVPPAVEVIALEPMEGDGHQECVTLTLAMDEGVPSSSGVCMIMPKAKPSPSKCLPKPAPDWDSDSSDDK